MGGERYRGLTQMFVLALSVSVLVSALVVGGIAASWLAVVLKQAQHERAELKARARAGRAKGAALEAAEEDPLFSPHEIKACVDAVLALAEALWRSSDLSGFEGRSDTHLITVWARAREAWLGGALDIDGQPSVDLLQVVNRGSESEDRVTARVRVHVHCAHPARFGQDAIGRLVSPRPCPPG